MLPTANGEHKGRRDLTPVLQRALASAGDGAFVIGTDGRIALWNRSAELMLGYTSQDVVGRPCCDVLDTRDDGGTRFCCGDRDVRPAVEMREPVRTFDLATRTKTGKLMWICVSRLVVPSDEGSGPLTVSLFRDVTAAKELLTRVQDRLLPPVADAAVSGRLTRRELELLRLMGVGLNTAAAAERLHVSRATIRNHVQNIFAKLGVHSRLEAVAYAHRQRLL